MYTYANHRIIKNGGGCLLGILQWYFKTLLAAKTVPPLKFLSVVCVSRYKCAYVISGLCVTVQVCIRMYVCAGSRVAVITGRGSHSKGREARIKPAVVSYLQKNGFL